MGQLVSPRPTDAYWPLGNSTVRRDLENMGTTRRARLQNNFQQRKHHRKAYGGPENCRGERLTWTIHKDKIRTYSDHHPGCVKHGKQCRVHRSYV